MAKWLNVQCLNNLLNFITYYKFEEEINLLCRITATNIFGGFLGTGGAY